MHNNKHSEYIKRCISIAKNGLGTTAPNPMVGCVIVYKNTIIGEGFTSPYGGSHAEVNAINAVDNKDLLKESTLYVTLEPCSHFGKTPPCADLITSYNIPNIVIGCIDPNDKVSGRGIAHLKKNGAHVITGIEEALCKLHHKRFLTFQTKKRPYIILKWAETKDGFVAPLSKSSKTPFWISGKISRKLVHQWRSEEQAIMVGGKTVLEDNPSLTTRHVAGNNPTRIVLDPHNNLPKEAAVFNNEAKTIVLNATTLDLKKPLAKQICSQLYLHNINSVIVEGGPKTIQLFLDEQLWDEARIFKSNKNLGAGIKSPKFKFKKFKKINVGDDLLYDVSNQK